MSVCTKACEEYFSCNSFVYHSALTCNIINYITIYLFLHTIPSVRQTVITIMNYKIPFQHHMLIDQYLRIPVYTSAYQIYETIIFRESASVCLNWRVFLLFSTAWASVMSRRRVMLPSIQHWDQTPHTWKICPSQGIIWNTRNWKTDPY